MSPLEIISGLCNVTEELADIVQKQQTAIEQSKIEEAVKAELRRDIKSTDRKMNILECNMRRYCDTDDIEKGERDERN